MAMVVPDAAFQRALKRQRENKLRYYKPQAKQLAFHSTATRERLFMAGNQLGKTYAGAAECVFHATGLYPPWWEGRRFDRHTVGWVAGETAETTRDSVQRLLVGDPADKTTWGTGFIPKRLMGEYRGAMGVSNALDYIQVKHVDGHWSTIYFKSYGKGREKWQAVTIDYVWFDEEPPADVYSEGLTRTNKVLGPVMITFTPLQGMSDVVTRFLMPAADDAGRDHRSVVQMGLDDAEHYTEEEKRVILASYPVHERDARAKGIPIMGSGRIFPLDESEIVCDPFPIPAHWPQIGGMDFGWDHPSAFVTLAWDRDADIIYVTREYRKSQATPIIHAAAVKPWGVGDNGNQWLPWAWPHDGHQHDKGGGEQLSQLYREQGLRLNDQCASFDDDRRNSVEAGLMEMLDRMQTGRWKVFKTCQLWVEEFRLYHRKDGKVVALVDDLLSASRYAYMDRRHAITQPKQWERRAPRFGTMA